MPSRTGSLGGGGGGGAPGGSGLTAEQLAVLNNLSFNEEANELSTGASLKAGLNSFSLGDMHTMSSGGENTFFKNNNSNIHWFPQWQGVRQYDGGNGSLVINPSTRIYSRNGVPLAITPAGATAHASINVTYTQVLTLTANESVLRLEVILGEDYIGEMEYTLRADSETGTVKFSQTIAVDGVEGDALEFIFDHPAESLSGDVIAVNMKKEDGSALLVRAAAFNNTSPWVRVTLLEFEDKVDGLNHIYYITANETLTNNGTNIVDTTSNSVRLFIANVFRGSFIVYDANESFNVQSPCTVAFGGTQGDAVLQTKNDAYLFYYADNEWKFLDLATKKGGTV